MIPSIYLHISPVLQHAHPTACHIHLSASHCIIVRYKFFTKTQQTPFERNLELSPNNKQAVHQIPWECFSHKPQFSLHFAGVTATYMPQPKECMRALISHPNEVCSEWSIAMHQKIKKPMDSSLPSFRVANSTQTPFYEIPLPLKDKIDLHIGKDVSREQAATLGALNAQMKTFEDYFWQALTHNYPLTIIHGKGEGKLRALIYEFVHEYAQQKNTSIHLYPHEDGGSTTISF